MDFLFACFMEKVIYFDQACQQIAAGLRYPMAVDFFRVLTYLGSPYAFIAVSLLVSIWLLGKRMAREVLVLNLVLFVSGRLNNYLKNFFGRERPEGEMLTYAAGFSFPSGHAMIATAFYGFLAYLAWKHLPKNTGNTVLVLMILVIVLIGLSRVYLNVHYMSDVIAGFIGGGVLLAAGIACNERWGRKC